MRKKVRHIVLELTEHFSIVPFDLGLKKFVLEIIENMGLMGNLT